MYNLYTDSHRFAAVRLNYFQVRMIKSTIGINNIPMCVFKLKRIDFPIF